MITVMMMNVFIGLLSTKYDDACALKHQILSHYKSEYCVKLLMLRLFFPCCHEGDDEHDESTCGHNELPAGDDFKHHMCGFWIASDADELKDANDIDSLQEFIGDQEKVM